jgi:hypothetical protein
MDEREIMSAMGGEGEERRVLEWLSLMAVPFAGKRGTGTWMGWGMERGWAHVIVEVSQRWKGL